MTDIDLPFSCIFSYTDHWTVFLSGEIDVTARPELLSVAETLAARGGDVDFDVSGVRFMDVSGWTALRAATSVARSLGCSARIVNPSPSVRHLTDVLTRSRTGRTPIRRPVAVTPASRAA